MDDQKKGRPPGEMESRRDFFVCLGKWSRAVITLMLAGAPGLSLASGKPETTERVPVSQPNGKAKTPGTDRGRKGPSEGITQKPYNTQSKLQRQARADFRPSLQPEFRKASAPGAKGVTEKSIFTTSTDVAVRPVADTRMAWIRGPWTKGPWWRWRQGPWLRWRQAPWQQWQEGPWWRWRQHPWRRSWRQYVRVY